MHAPKPFPGPLFLQKFTHFSFCLALIALLFAAAGGPPAGAAETGFTVRVDTQASGMPFFVDAQRYVGAAAFVWQPGSRHVLATFPQDNPIRSGSRYSFLGWYGSGTLLGGGREVVVTADPLVTSYTAAFGTEHKLGLRFYRCAVGAACRAPGVIHVNEDIYDANADLWFAAGDVVRFRAVATPGWAFAGWSGASGASVEGLDLVLTITGPVNLYANFVTVRHVELLTEPPGLRVSADHNPVVTPVTMDWGWDTVHSLAPVTPQVDAAGQLWVFRAWSDGGSAVRSYKVPGNGYDASLTALYVRAAHYSLSTSPPLLKLRIDGRDNWMSYNFDWGVGETHRVEAPERQTDAQGRVYLFRGWSNGVTAGAQDVVVTEGDLAAGARLSAVYELLARVVIQANVPGAIVSADGVACALPCTLDRPAGTSVRVSVPASVAAGEGRRYDFRGWSDGGPAERSVTFTAEGQGLSASFAVMHRLETVSDPADGARWRREPASPDGYYEAQATVALTAQANPGFRFRYLEGDVTSSFSSAFLKMDGPKFVRAVLEGAPKIATAGVRNGAAETPDDVVAAGSVISIFGMNLAPSTETGPASPLAQTLAGVTVRAGDRLLPLLYASPIQINAQLLSGIEPGPQTLVVKWAGNPEVRANFEVARNAPGLFESFLEERAYGIALHADGTLITLASPARRAEIITLFGTGFGPTDRQPPDGFALPERPAFTLIDAVEVFAAGIPFAPVWAGSSPNRVGVQEVRLRIAPELPAATAIPLTVRIGGRDSNTVLVPVE
jgi:uncharacterized protein (TIGR03437 family)